jgi:hypothetical protein
MIARIVLMRRWSLYLEFFCQAQPKNRTVAGNVLVNLGIAPSQLLMPEENIQIMHGAYWLRAGKILEKTSNGGSPFGKNENRERAGVYEINTHTGASKNTEID